MANINVRDAHNRIISIKRVVPQHTYPTFVYCHVVDKYGKKLYPECFTQQQIESGELI